MMNNINSNSLTKKQRRNQQWKRNNYLRKMEKYLSILPEDLVTNILEFYNINLSFDKVKNELVEQRKLEIQIQIQNQMLLDKKAIETQLKYKKMEIIEQLKICQEIEFCSIITKIYNYIEKNYHDVYIPYNIRFLVEDYNEYLQNNEIHSLRTIVNCYKKFIITELKKWLTIQMIDGIIKNNLYY